MYSSATTFNNLDTGWRTGMGAAASMADDSSAITLGMLGG
jgi:hypothetical protein